MTTKTPIQSASVHMDDERSGGSADAQFRPLLLIIGIIVMIASLKLLIDFSAFR